MGRKPTCACGECPKCVMRVAARERYQAMSPEERKAWVARRDPEKVKAADRARYKRDREKRRAAQRAYAQTEEGRERLRESSKKWTERNPEKRKAQNALSRAIRTGKIERGTACAEANGECSGRIEGHHEDYSKPLEVTWLCVFHHAQTRKKYED